MHMLNNMDILQQMINEDYKHIISLSYERKEDMISFINDDIFKHNTVIL